MAVFAQSPTFVAANMPMSDLHLSLPYVMHVCVVHITECDEWNVE